MKSKLVKLKEETYNDLRSIHRPMWELLFRKKELIDHGLLALFGNYLIIKKEQARFVFIYFYMNNPRIRCKGNLELRDAAHDVKLKIYGKVKNLNRKGRGLLDE